MVVRSRVQKGTRWNIRQPDADIVSHLCESGGFTSVIANVLVNRGYFDMDSVERFTHSNLKMLRDPMELSGVSEASERIITAIRSNEKIIIYGDYDVDGITATSLLVRILKELGGNVTYFIPDRAGHGYGLHVETIELLAGKGAKVIITVDCGISAIKPAVRAKELGIDLIITDHHEPKTEELESKFDISPSDCAVEGEDYVTDELNIYVPDAYAVINPKLGHYGFSELAGVGVAFKLAHGLLKLARERNIDKAFKIELKEYLDLVALGTIADSVPLRDENRILVKHGLITLMNSRKPGIQELIKVARVKELNVRSVAFGIAPRINAAGRLGDANDAVKLLLTTNSGEAFEIVRELDNINKQRQKIERETYAAARELFEQEFDVELPDGLKLPGGLYRYIPDGPKAIVLASSEWNPGVIGIVASRMVDRYYLPAVIISIDGERGRGSCRSTRDFHMFDALCKCNGLLEQFGGHKVAAGVTVESRNIDALRIKLNSIAREELGEAGAIPVLDADAEIELKDCNLDMVEMLNTFKPYGQSNPKPTFIVRRVKLVEGPVVLKEKHIKFCVMQKGEYRKIIAFNWAERENEICTWAEMDILIHPYLSHYRGVDQLEIQLIDAKESSWKN